MQQEETIIKQLAKMIKDAQPQVDENPILLNKIFAAMEAKRKKRRFLFILLIVSIISTAGFLGIYEYYSRPTVMVGETVSQSFSLVHASSGACKLQYMVAIDHQIYSQTYQDKKIKKSTQAGTHHYSIKTNMKNAVKVPPLKVWEFNIYGEDGSEQDALQVIREMKETKGKRKPQEE
jgi:hypothetical protein